MSMRKTVLTMLPLLVLACTVADPACAGSGLTDSPPGAVVAKVGGQPLHEAEVRMATGAYLAKHPPSTREDIQNAETSARVDMARKLALAQLAETDGIAKDPDIQGQLAYYRIQVLAQAYLKDQMNKHPITKADVEAEYAPGGKIMRYHLQHILLPQESQAEKVEQLLKKKGLFGGKENTFGELAKKYSADTNSADKDGDIGWLRLDSFEEYQIVDAIRALKPGQHTRPLLTRNGWEIFRLKEAPKQIKNSVTFKQLPQNVVQRLELRVEHRRVAAIEAAAVSKVTAVTGTGKPLDIKMAHE